MKQSNNKDAANNTEFEKLPHINKKQQHFSNHLSNIISSLSSPRFLGSIHMKNTTSANKSLENLVESELQLKTTKAIKSTLFNPVTKILILLAIVFNLVWFIFAAIL